MSAGLLAERGIGARLRHECTSRGLLVSEVIKAHASGELDDAMALRACAFEVHSLTGVASVLGLNTVSSILSGVSDLLFTHRMPPRASFWGDFPRFFEGVIECIMACAEAQTDSDVFDATRELRNRVLEGLEEPKLTHAQCVAHASEPDADRRKPA